MATRNWIQENDVWKEENESSRKYLALPEWIPLKTLPDPFSQDKDPNHHMRTSEIVMMNENELIVAPEWPTSFYLKRIGLFKYNIPDNKWSLFMNYTSSLFNDNYYNPEDHHICIDNKTNTIYSTGKESKLTTINLIEKTYCPKMQSSYCAKMVYIFMTESICHIIADKAHLSNSNGFDFEFKDEFPFGRRGFEIIHVPSQNTLFMFGGNNGKILDEIWSYSIGSRKWMKLIHTLPRPICNFGIIMSLDEKYVVIFGGCIREWRNTMGQTRGEYSSDIIIVNLSTLKYTISPIKVPIRKNWSGKTMKVSQYHAVKCSATQGNEILVHGFIKRSCRNMNINIPLEIAQLICSWYTIEYVYLISTRGYLWKININDIMKSTQLPS